MNCKYLMYVECRYVSHQKLKLLRTKLCTAMLSDQGSLKNYGKIAFTARLICYRSVQQLQLLTHIIIRHPEATCAFVLCQPSTSRIIQSLNNFSVFSQTFLRHLHDFLFFLLIFFPSNFFFLSSSLRTQVVFMPTSRHRLYRQN